ncbi:MAG: response regulator transcription factor [Anaerovoracaceae bacterium]
MKKILVVEDDRHLNTGIAMALQGGTLTLDSAYDVSEAWDCLNRVAKETGEGYDLVILDVNLPDGSGLDLLMKLRNRSSVPVILLTANDMETDIVTGLAMGADDYITKPFSLAVLRARVQVQLRRNRSDKIHSPGTSADAGALGCFSQGEFHFDFPRMEFRGLSGSVELSRTEQKLLRILVENPGRVVSRQRLLEHVWGEGSEYVDENALSVAVKRLRDKLGAAEEIRTVYGVGYQWVKP